MVARKGAGDLSGADPAASRYEYATVGFPHTDWEKPLYTIGVAAELAGVHPQTLRAYEQKGLVTPKRTSGGTRMYSLADLDRLALIGKLTEEGINLAGVTRILDLESRLGEAHEQLEDLHARDVLPSASKTCRTTGRPASARSSGPRRKKGPSSSGRCATSKRRPSPAPRRRHRKTTHR